MDGDCGLKVRLLVPKRLALIGINVCHADIKAVQQIQRRHLCEREKRWIVNVYININPCPMKYQTFFPPRGAFQATTFSHAASSSGLFSYIRIRLYIMLMPNSCLNFYR